MYKTDIIKPVEKILKEQESFLLQIKPMAEELQKILLSFGSFMEPYAKAYRESYQKCVSSHCYEYTILQFLKENACFLEEFDINYCCREIVNTIKMAAQTFLEIQVQIDYFYVTRNLEDLDIFSYTEIGMTKEIFHQMMEEIQKKAYTFPYDTSLHFLVPKWEKKSDVKKFLSYIKKQVNETDGSAVAYPILDEKNIVRDIAIYVPKEDNLMTVLSKIETYILAYALFQYKDLEAPCVWPDVSTTVSSLQKSFLEQLEQATNKEKKLLK